MIQRQNRFYSLPKQFVHQLFVKRHTSFIDRTFAIRHDSRPRHAEAIGFQAHLLHQGNIFFVSMVVIDRHFAVGFLKGIAGNLGIGIPNRRTFAVFCPCTFNLIGRRSRPPIRSFLGKDLSLCETSSCLLQFLNRVKSVTFYRIIIWLIRNNCQKIFFR